MQASSLMNRLLGTAPRLVLAGVLGTFAGTAWADEAKPYLPKGPSGVAVRTLAELAFTSHDWKLE